MPASSRFIFAPREQDAADPRPGSSWMNEEGADSRGVHTGLGERSVACGILIAAEEFPPLTPAAAAHNPVLGFRDEVRAVANQSCINAEDVPIAASICWSS